MDDARRYLAAIPRGLETVAADELRRLGAGIAGTRPGSVLLDADPRVAFHILLHARTLLRLQELLFEAPVKDADELYRACRDRPWEALLTNKTTFRVDAALPETSFRQSNFAALKVKDAVVDRLREVTGDRPSVDRKNPDVPLKIWIAGTTLHVYRELSGESLHKRGYRDVQVKGPVNESLAAGLLMIAGWTPEQPLVDPMCGSATFLVEAAWMALGRPPGLTRAFAMERWPDVDPLQLKRARDEARRTMRSSPPALRLFGSDHHRGALSIAERALYQAEVAPYVQLEEASIADLRSPYPAPMVITNPPYGERLGEGPDLALTWGHLGRFLKHECTGGQAYVLCGEPELTRSLRLKAVAKHPVWNGPIECRFLHYDLYAGSRAPASPEP